MSKASAKNQNTSANNDCFVIMPISDPDGYDKGHFRKVYEDIFKVAIDRAGYIPVRADQVKQTNLIHLDILRKLLESPMAICDLSHRNPNVLFELGLRQAFDKPTVLVQEEGTPQIFDISPLRYTEYRKELKYREVMEDQDAVAEAIKATKEATEKGDDINSIVKLLSITNPASFNEVSDNTSAQMFQIIMSEINSLKSSANFSSKFNEGVNALVIPSNLRKLERDYMFHFESVCNSLFKAIENNEDFKAVSDRYDEIINLNIALENKILLNSNQERVRLLLAAVDKAMDNYRKKSFNLFDTK